MTQHKLCRVRAAQLLLAGSSPWLRAHDARFASAERALRAVYPRARDSVRVSIKGRPSRRATTRAQGDPSRAALAGADQTGDAATRPRLARLLPSRCPRAHRESHRDRAPRKSHGRPNVPRRCFTALLEPTRRPPSPPHAAATGRGAVPAAGSPPLALAAPATRCRLARAPGTGLAAGALV